MKKSQDSADSIPNSSPFNKFQADAVSLQFKTRGKHKESQASLLLTTEGENLTVTPSCMTIVNEDNVSLHKAEPKPQGHINLGKLKQI